MVGKEVQALYHLVIPGNRVEIENERQEPQQSPDANDLKRASQHVSCAYQGSQSSQLPGPGRTYRNRDTEADGNTGSNSDGSLAVVIGAEQGGILKRAVGWMVFSAKSLFMLMR